MKTRRLLVVYSTVDGQAEAIARRIGQVAAADREVQATVRDVRETSATDLTLCDSIIIVAAVHLSRHPRPVTKFVKANRELLSKMHSAFISISGSAADPSTRQLALDYADGFLRKTGWKPSQREIFGGAIKFTKYNPLLRFVMKRIGASKGQILDTRIDYDFTDWNAVAQFATAFVAEQHVKVA